MATEPADVVEGARIIERELQVLLKDFKRFRQLLEFAQKKHAKELSKLKGKEEAAQKEAADLRARMEATRPATLEAEVSCLREQDWLRQQELEEVKKAKGRLEKAAADFNKIIQARADAFDSLENTMQRRPRRIAWPMTRFRRISAS